jgi:DNA-binding GntR family transcriptional regulator
MPDPAAASPSPASPAGSARRVQRVEHANLDRKAHEILKSLIVGRQLAPGEKIPQEKLAAELGISRTPLVNALKLLEKENLVEARPRRGYFVRAFGTQEMISVFELREVLEGLAVRKATETITDAQKAQLRRFFRAFAGKKRITDLTAYAREDEAFHSYLIALADHRFLRDILEAHDVVHVSYQTTAAAGLLRPPEDTIGDHLAIIDAICAGNARQAERAMRTHLANTIAVLRRQLAADAAQRAKDNASPTTPGTRPARA